MELTLDRKRMADVKSWTASAAIRKRDGPPLSNAAGGGLEGANNDRVRTDATADPYPPHGRSSSGRDGCDALRAELDPDPRPAI